MRQGTNGRILAYKRYMLLYSHINRLVKSKLIRKDMSPKYTNKKSLKNSMGTPFMQPHFVELELAN